MGTLEILKGMPRFLLPGPSGSPWGIFMKWQCQVLLEPFFFFFGWFRAVLSSSRSPYPSISNLFPCPNNYLLSVDTPPSWRVWEFPNAFIHKTLRSVNRCLIFENIFCPPMLPVHFILKCGSTLSLSPLGGCLKIFLGECVWYRWISEESTRRLGFQLQG